MGKRPEYLTTSYAAPWALVRRGGDTTGKRPSTRMAFITKANAVAGNIVSFTGYVMNNDMTGWTKHTVKIEVADVVTDWRRQPSVTEVRRVKARMPIITAENRARDTRAWRDWMTGAGAELECGQSRR